MLSALPAPRRSDGQRQSRRNQVLVSRHGKQFDLFRVVNTETVFQSRHQNCTISATVIVQYSDLGHANAGITRPRQEEAGGPEWYSAVASGR